MKLKPCKSCGNQVSPSAKACPKCGQPIRTGEALKNAGLLTIDADDSKTRSRRIVELPNACVEWLQLGGDLPAHNARHRLAAVATAAGIHPWPRDGLRHSAASYWHALKGEVVTARNLGHSEAVLHRHYRALTTQREARRFFTLVP